jgi:hypothetical protein
MNGSAYGLGIISAVPLPELVHEDRHIDVRIRFGNVMCTECSCDNTRWFGITGNEGHLHHQIGTFRVRNGDEITISPARDADESELRLFLLGPALALLLHQRGQLVLHASAISIGDQAVAFLGEHGWGKSTLAGALYARGHTIVADDVVAVHAADTQPTVYPGFPQLKLWPEAVRQIGGEPADLPRLHRRYEKRAYPAHRGFSTRPLPLRCIYVLAEDSQALVEDIATQASLVELIRHTYTTRVLETTPDPGHFRQCVSLASSIPVRRLKVKRSLAALSEAAATVERDVGQNLA